MTRQFLHPDLASATEFGLDDHDINQGAQVATNAYARMAKAWQLDGSVAKEMRVVDPRTWLQIKNGTWSGSLDQEQLMRISEVIGLYNVLRSYFNDNPADRWVTLPNKGRCFPGASRLISWLIAVCR